jgi:hypothetical protein
MSGQNISLETAKEILSVDFAQSYQQMRHYDALEMSIAKFVLAGTTSVIGASFVLYRLGIDKELDFSKPISLVLVLSFLIGILMVGMFVRNRCYFVIVARHVNKIRNLCLNQKLPGFEPLSGIYGDENKPAYFNPVSTYSLMLYLLCLLNSVMFAGSIYALVKRYPGLCILILMVSFVTHLAVAVSYFRKQERGQG